MAVQSVLSVYLDGCKCLSRGEKFFHLNWKTERDFSPLGDKGKKPTVGKGEDSGTVSF